MKKEFYGKSVEDFNENEKKLFILDTNILKMTFMVETNPILKLLSQMRGGPSLEDKAIIRRTIFAGTEILGMATPITQEDYTAVENAVEESPYGSQKFVDDITEDFDDYMKERGIESGSEETPKIFETYMDEKSAQFGSENTSETPGNLEGEEKDARIGSEETPGNLEGEEKVEEPKG